MAGITRRTFAQGLATVAVSAPTRAAARPGYPAGLTVKFVVGFPAGGAQDIVGRVIADRLGALWKVPTGMENVAGAGGTLRRSAPVLPSSPLTLAPSGPKGAN